MLRKDVKINESKLCNKIKTANVIAMMKMMMNYFAEWLGGKNDVSLISSRDHSLLEVITIVNIRHTASRIWACAESQLRLCWMNLCSSDNHKPYYVNINDYQQRGSYYTKITNFTYFNKCKKKKNRKMTKINKSIILELF